jgi:hypothetical protein
MAWKRGSHAEAQRRRENQEILTTDFADYADWMERGIRLRRTQGRRATTKYTKYTKGGLSPLNHREEALTTEHTEYTEWGSFTTGFTEKKQIRNPNIETRNKARTSNRENDPNQGRTCRPVEHEVE